MGFWSTFIATFLVTDRVQKNRAAKKAQAEPIIVDSDTLEPDEMKSYDITIEVDNVTVDASLKTHGPPVGIELFTATGHQRRMRGDDAEPIAQNDTVDVPESEHTTEVDEGQYVLNVYRKPDSPDEPSDYELKVSCY